jgi:hypothetical protein
MYTKVIVLMGMKKIVDLFVIDLVDGKLNQAPVRTLSLIVCVCEMADNPNSIVFTRP